MKFTLLAVIGLAVLSIFLRGTKTLAGGARSGVEAALLLPGTIEPPPPPKRRS